MLVEARRTPVGTDSPPLDRTRRVRRIHVEYQTDEGDWLEGEEADRYWSAVRQLILDAWTQGKEAYTLHVNSHWNHYVSTDKSVKAHVDYEAGPDEDAQRFAARLPGRRLIQALPENGKVLVKIDLGPQMLPTSTRPAMSSASDVRVRSTVLSLRYYAETFRFEPQSAGQA